jgi:hypothetical protein
LQLTIGRLFIFHPAKDQVRFLLACAGDNDAESIALDASGDVFVTGDTSSTNFPTTAGAFQTRAGFSQAGATFNPYVTKLNPTATGVVYSTYLGGSGSPPGGDLGMAITLNAAGAAYVSGYTNSANFPTQNPPRRPMAAGRTPLSPS